MAMRGFRRWWILASMTVACAKPEAIRVTLPAEARPFPIHVEHLTDLLPAADVQFFVRILPARVAKELELAIRPVIPPQNIDALAASTGIDLREVPEALMAQYHGALGPSTCYVVRHSGDIRGIESRFQKRLVAKESRVIEDNLVRVSGATGTQTEVLVLAGSNIAIFQVGGHPSRGCARVASLYATNKLKRSPTITANVLSRSILEPQDPAGQGVPLVSFGALGPFEGEATKALGGMLTEVGAVGVNVWPTQRSAIRMSVVLLSEHLPSTAIETLKASWDALAADPLGRLMGLNKPLSEPAFRSSDLGAEITVDLDPIQVGKGLASATSSSIREIMK